MLMNKIKYLLLNYADNIEIKKIIIKNKNMLKYNNKTKNPKNIQ